jgi:hypothetical protein
MVKCRYVGGDCSTIGLGDGEVEYDTIGQRATMTERGFREAVLGGAPFIPDEYFDRVDFTPQELSQWGQVGVRVDTSTRFEEKLGVAQEMFRDLCARMRANQSLTLAELLDRGVSEVELVG